MKMALVIISLWALGSLVLVLGVAYLAGRPIPPVGVPEAEEDAQSPELEHCGPAETDVDGIETVGSSTAHST